MWLVGGELAYSRENGSALVYDYSGMIRNRVHQLFQPAVQNLEGEGKTFVTVNWGTLNWGGDGRGVGRRT